MNDLCTSCGKPPHAGGCKLAASNPEPSGEETQRRLEYLASDEFRRERAASLAGLNLAGASENDLLNAVVVQRNDAREEARREKVRAEKAMVLLREKEDAIAAANTEIEMAWRSNNANVEALAAARRECEGLRKALEPFARMADREPDRFEAKAREVLMQVQRGPMVFEPDPRHVVAVATALAAEAAETLKLLLADAGDANIDVRSAIHRALRALASPAAAPAAVHCPHGKGNEPCGVCDMPTAEDREAIS